MTVEAKLASLISENALEAAVSLAAEHLSRKPSDGPVRAILIDLLIVAGEFDRADKHAMAAAKLDPAAAVGSGQIRLLLRGMEARAAWRRDGALPTFPLGPSACDRAAIRLDLSLRDGSAVEVAESLAVLDATRGERPATWNGEPVSDLRDLDDRTAHAIEAITDGGSYLWIDLALVRSLEFAPIARLRDLAYRRARLTLADGSAADVLAPAIYPAGPKTRPELLLGRETEWEDMEGGVVAGRGLRCFLAGDEMRAINEAEAVTLESLMEASLG